MHMRCRLTLSRVMFHSWFSQNIPFHINLGVLDAHILTTFCVVCCAVFVHFIELNYIVHTLHYVSYPTPLSYWPSVSACHMSLSLKWWVIGFIWHVHYHRVNACVRDYSLYKTRPNSDRYTGTPTIQYTQRERERMRDRHGMALCVCAKHAMSII